MAETWERSKLYDMKAGKEEWDLQGMENVNDQEDNLNMALIYFFNGFSAWGIAY